MDKKVCFEVDLSGVASREEFHKRICQTLPCPSYYGDNLDALYDVLTENSEPWEISFTNLETMEQQLPGYLAALREMCEDATGEKTGLQVIFIESQALE